MDKLKQDYAIDLIHSVRFKGLGNLAKDIAECTIDSLIENENIKSIPILGSLCNAYDAFRSVHSALELKKFIGFLSAISEVPLNKREEFIQSQGHVFAERVMLLIDKADDLLKPVWIGSIVKAHIRGYIFSEHRTFRLCQMINGAYVGDLEQLRRFQRGKQDDAEVADLLEYQGFLNIYNQNAEGFERHCPHYELSSYGSDFVSFALENYEC